MPTGKILAVSNAQKNVTFVKIISLNPILFKAVLPAENTKLNRKLTACSSTNVIYLATCIKCNLQYVGSTTTPFKIRFRNHKSSMKTKKKTCEVAIHFNATPHHLCDFQFICIEKINNENNLERKLITREGNWTAQLRTLHPWGLNKRVESNSKNRIHYK